MAVATSKYGNWTTYVGTLAEVNSALATHVAQEDRTWVLSDGTSVIGLVYGE